MPIRSASRGEFESNVLSEFGAICYKVLDTFHMYRNFYVEEYLEFYKAFLLLSLLRI